MNNTALCFAVLTLPAFAASPTIYRYNFSGPRTVIAGYTHIYQFDVKYSFEFTCDPATGTCSTADIPVNGQTGTLSTTGTPPGGLYTVLAGAWPQYAICDVSGNNFRIHRVSCSGQTETITSAGTGVHRFILNSWGGKSVYLDNPAGSGLPAGITFRWRKFGTGYACNEDPWVDAATKKYYSYNTDFTWCLYVNVSTATEPGTYSPSLRFCERPDGQTNCSSYTFSIDVVRLPAFTLSGHPDSVPSIPGLSRWKDVMTSSDPVTRGAGFWCADQKNPKEQYVACPESSVCYYDGARVYYQIADFTRNSKWDNCARNISSYYIDYLVSNGGNIPAYRVFPHGLAEGMSRTPVGSWDGRAEVALRDYLTKTAYVLYGATPSVYRDREMAYALDTDVVVRSKLQKTLPYYQDHADAVIGLLLKYSEPVAADRADYQPFILGLLFEAAISHWELTQDPRVPYVVKRALDDVWKYYDTHANVLAYNTGTPGGPYCMDQSSTAWFNSDSGGGCGTAADYHKKLMNLISPAFAWYWKISGDDTYRVRGDSLFSHALDVDIFSGKEFSQNYRWSFKYVQWRSGR
jgi:hypothetical protein